MDAEPHIVMPLSQQMVQLLICTWACFLRRFIDCNINFCTWLLRYEGCVVPITTKCIATSLDSGVLRSSTIKPTFLSSSLSMGFSTADNESNTKVGIEIRRAIRLPLFRCLATPSHVLLYAVLPMTRHPHIDVDERINGFSQQSQTNQPRTPWTTNIRPVLGYIDITPIEKAICSPAS